MDQHSERAASRCDVSKDGAARVDERAIGALPHASVDVVGLWRTTTQISGGDVPPVGLAAGERPAADVEVLASAVAGVEYELARRMHAARAAGALPLHDPGAMLGARGWARSTARRLDRCGALAATHPSIAAAWGAGLVTSEHIDPIARSAERFSAEELAALVAELEPHWGSWAPASITRFVHAADQMLHPPPDPTGDEADAHDSRFLSFALTKDSVLLSGSWPKVEGELVIAAIDALAERLRSTADHVPAGARRADALVELVNTAHAQGALPTRGGLPVALTVTLDHTSLGDPIWTTSRGHLLTAAEARWAGCDADITPVLTTSPLGRPGQGEPDDLAVEELDGWWSDSAAEWMHPGSVVADERAPSADMPSPGARIAALATLLFDTKIPLAVGRTHRTATPAQRRALARRDRGCLIPGCAVPAEACQAHHLTEWSDSGNTDLPNMTLLCWAHHRQVDLRMWTIQAGRPPGPAPEPGAPPGTPWPANNGAPFTITRTPRHQWRT